VSLIPALIFVTWMFAVSGEFASSAAALSFVSYGGIYWLIVGAVPFAVLILAWMIAVGRSGLVAATIPIHMVLCAFASWMIGLARPPYSSESDGVDYALLGALAAALCLLVAAAVAIWFDRLRAPARARAAAARTPQALAAREAAREQQTLEQQAEAIRRYEAAYALAHGGERPPAGAMPSTAFIPAAQPRINVMAVLSLVFSLAVGSVLAVIFGHVALGQIRRTGDNGRGLAIAGLVIGYIGIGAGLVVAVVWLAVGVQFFR